MRDKAQIQAAYELLKSVLAGKRKGKVSARADIDRLATALDTLAWVMRDRRKGAWQNQFGTNLAGLKAMLRDNQSGLTWSSSAKHIDTDPEPTRGTAIDIDAANAKSLASLKAMRTALAGDARSIAAMSRADKVATATKRGHRS